MKSYRKEYAAWASMRQRCFNPKNKAFKHYGGRGITICERWVKSFDNFFADMGEKPSPIHSIDRINVDGNYEPSNCRWATPAVQGANKRYRKSKYLHDIKDEIYRTKKGLSIAKILAHNLIVLREKHKLSIIQVAKELGLTRNGMYQIESGKNWISVRQIERLSSLYKVDDIELFRFPEDTAKVTT